METFFVIYVWVLTALLGVCVGSFLNVVIYRVPENMSIAFPPSHCPKCGYRLRFYDNIPVLSYLILGGRCRQCRERISPRYLIVELLNMALWLLSLWFFGSYSLVYAGITAVALSVAVCICFIDLDHMIILGRFQILLALLGVCAVFFDPYEKPLSHLIGAVCAGGVFLLVAFIAEKILGREALGGGDIKLVAAMGLFLGWKRILLTVLVASVVASVVLIIVRRCHHDEKEAEYPFGPFLTFGFAFSLFLGEPLINAYLSLLF